MTLFGLLIATMTLAEHRLLLNLPKCYCVKRDNRRTGYETCETVYELSEKALCPLHTYCFVVPYMLCLLGNPYLVRPSATTFSCYKYVARVHSVTLLFKQIF